MPSVSALWIEFVLLPHAASVRAAAMSEKTERDLIVIGRIGPGTLSGGDRRPASAATVLLEDRPQAAHRAGRLALEPAARAERLADAIGQVAGLGLERERHACASRADRLELVGAQRADPVVLASAAALDDQPW